MEDRLLEIAMNELYRRLNAEIEIVEKIRSDLINLRKSLPIHLELKDEYQALLDKYQPEWEAMQKRRMDREKLWRKTE